MPARSAMPKPSPVLISALVEVRKMRAAPPVASSVVRASISSGSPLSISKATTPNT